MRTERPVAGSRMLRINRTVAKHFWQVGSVAGSSSNTQVSRSFSVSKAMIDDRSDMVPGVYPLKYGRNDVKFAPAEQKGKLPWRWEK
jgi:hypothetical protein